ncbi:MAG: TIGR03960 family B12-binding radical SAM protein [bacterium]
MRRSALLKEIETRVLPSVSKPARYAGGELNAAKKNWNSAQVRFALAFPDLYEIGMSNLGFLILYHVINDTHWALCERVFAPWHDMESALREHNVPLFSLESRRPLADFDVVGFSLSYELTYTNVLTMLSLAGIPFRAADRTDRHPLIIAGGGCTANPEPIAPALDAVVIGEGEEVILEILRIIRSRKKSGETSRTTLLSELAGIDGIYVPPLYAAFPDSGTLRVEPAVPAAPRVISKRYLRQLDAAVFPTRPVVPSVQAVHDRANIELFRGCVRGCRFCQAGFIYRPMRNRSPSSVIESAKALYAATGFDEISLLSLNTTDYPALLPVLRELSSFAEPGKITLSLPSTRLDSFLQIGQGDLGAVGASTLTFAPEAATQRLRNVINKQLTEDDMLNGVEAAARAGWRRVKLYFMIGLPTETSDDVEAIPCLLEKFRSKAQLHRRRKLVFSVSVSNFVPKPHTPFQWRNFETLESLRVKQRLLRKKIHWKNFELKFHNVETSFLEAVFSRGDRRLFPVLETAWNLGCRFDGWSESFSFDRWMNAFDINGIAPQSLAHSQFPLDKPLPWSHISTGVSEKFLRLELERASGAHTTRGCLDGTCNGCGINC